jgi:hypothetical protein
VIRDGKSTLASPVVFLLSRLWCSTEGLTEILSLGTSRKLSECPFSLRAQIAILFS